MFFYTEGHGGLAEGHRGKLSLIYLIRNIAAPWGAIVTM